MRVIFVTIFLVNILFGSNHMAKIEPLEIYSIKSAVNGKVVKSVLSKETKSVDGFEIIKIDSKTDIENLRFLKTELKNLQNILKINEKVLENLKELSKIKKENFNRIKNLKTKSKFEKDTKLADYLIINNQYQNQKEKILNLKNQIANIKYNIKRLEDILEKKSIKVFGYVYKIYVKSGDYVAPGTKLVDVADISKGKIVIYLDKDEIENIENKKIYIDGKETNLWFNKIDKIADPVHISAYRAEILIDAPKIFSKIVKVEIK